MPVSLSGDGATIRRKESCALPSRSRRRKRAAVLPELALRLWRLRRKDVPRLRLAPLDFAGAGLAEALGRARMGLQLGHCSSRMGLAWLPTPKSPRDRDFPASLRLQSVYRKPAVSPLYRRAAGVEASRIWLVEAVEAHLFGVACCGRQRANPAPGRSRRRSGAGPEPICRPRKRLRRWPNADRAVFFVDRA